MFGFGPGINMDSTYNQIFKRSSYIPNYYQLLYAFQNIHNQRERTHDLLYNEFQQFCFSKNLNLDINSFNLFFQMKFPNSPIPYKNPAPTANPIPTANSYPNINDELKPKIPRGDYEVYEGPKDTKDPNFMNIVFELSTGFKVNFTLPKTTTVNELIKKYMDRLKLPYEHLEKDIEFIFGGQKIDPYSKKSIFTSFYNNNNSVRVTVFDKGSVIGGTFN